MELFAAEKVAFSYGGPDVLRDVSLSVNAGGVVALLGPNGSGKTTLLKTFLGLLRPVRGTVRFGGRDLHRISRREFAQQVAYVPQLHRETFAYTIGHVVLMGRMPNTHFLGRYGEADRRAAREALETLGIEHLADRPCTEVSGGERQLALIARAMAQGARVLLMDEPTNGLDYGNQVRLLERLGSLARQGFTFLFSTHHPEHALAVANRVVMMWGGKVVGDGAPRIAITANSLRDLYGVDVRMIAVDESVNVCVPALRFAERDGGLCGG